MGYNSTTISINCDILVTKGNSTCKRGTTLSGRCDTAPPAVTAAINAMIHQALHAWQNQMEKYCAMRNGCFLVESPWWRPPHEAPKRSWGIVREYDDEL